LQALASFNIVAMAASNGKETLALLFAKHKQINMWREISGNMAAWSVFDGEDNGNTA